MQMHKPSLNGSNRVTVDLNLCIGDLKIVLNRHTKDPKRFMRYTTNVEY